VSDSGSPSLRVSPRAAQTSLYVAGFIALGLVDGGVGPSLSTFAANAGVSLGEIAIIVAAMALGRLTGSAIAGRLYARAHGHRALAAGYALTALAAAAITFVPGVPAAAAAFFLLGGFSSTVDVGSNTLIQWTHGDRVGPYMNGLHLAFGAGGALAPLLIAASLTLSGQVRVAWLVIGAVNALIMLAALTVSPPKPSVSAAASAAGKRPPTATLALVGLLFFAYAGCEATMFTWTADYGVSLGFDRTGAATALATAFWLSFMAGRLFAIPATHRWPIRTVSIGALGLGIISGLAFVLSAGQSPWIWIAVCGLGVAIGPIFPNMLAFAGERLGATAGITGFVFVLTSVGAMLWPWLAGQLFEPTRGAVIPLMAFGFAAVSLLLFGLFDRATHLSRKR